MARSMEPWPPLPLAEWRPTYATLHLWMQVIGKIKLAFTPLENHWWNSTLQVTARGLSTKVMPYRDGGFELRFDFIDHRLLIETSWSRSIVIDLQPQCCADFYQQLFSALDDLDIDVSIWPVTVEMPEVTRLDQDRKHASYDREYVERWWRILLSVHNVFTEFRSRFLGKSSPSHFFWGSFDLAVTRFSGRRAPPRPGADAMMAEAYSHEVSSAGFWPGSGPITDAAFYAYAAPQPEGFASAPVLPAAGRYNHELGEFILMYDDVRTSRSPRATLLDFLQTTYEAAANCGAWDRQELERSNQA